MSTRTALTVVGGIVGAYFGYPQLGLVVGSLVGGAVDPQRIEGPQINETGVQTSAEGVQRPIVWGTIDVTGNIMHKGPSVKTTTEESQGKGGGPEVTTNHLNRSYAIRICEGPIAAVLRIWADNKLVYDMRTGSQMTAESEQWIANKVIYLGDETQLPDPTLVAIDADAPSHRGTAYIVFILEDLTERAGSIPQYRYEVAKEVHASVESGHQGPSEVFYLDSLANGDPFVLNNLVGGSGGFAGVGYPGTYDVSVFSASDFTTASARTSFEQITNGGSVDDQRLWVRAVDTDGYAISADNNFGHCELIQLGSAYGKLFPTSGAIGTDWWYAEANYFPEYGGLVWIYGGAIYLGARRTGSSGTSWNRIMKFSKLLPGNQIPTASILGVSANTVAPVFWMHVSRTGIVRAIDSMDYTAMQQYDSNLLPLADATVPPSISAIMGGPGVIFRGFGVDEDKGLQAYAYYVTSPGAFHVDVFDLDGTLRAQNVFAAGINNVLTRMVFTEANLFVQNYTQTFVVATPTTGAGLPAILGDIVGDIYDRCGGQDFYDVSELTDEVDGFVCAGSYTGADAIGKLVQGYWFDISGHDKKNYHPKRGAAVIETLTINDLLEIPDTNAREQAIERPKKLHLKYKHAASGYAAVKATSPRANSPDVLTTGEAIIELPVVLDEDQAAKKSDVIYKIVSTEVAGETEIVVPFRVGAKYVTGNNLGLILRGSVTRQRIDSIDFQPWQIKLTLKPDRQSAYTSNLTGVPIPAPELPPSTIIGETQLAVLDIAARVDSEDDLNYYVAVSGALPPWYGARYQRSLDGGASYTSVLDIRTASIMGELQDNITDASEFFTDTVNVLNVSLYRDSQTLESISDEEFLSQGNGFALEKADGSWELMQFQDATQNSDGSWTLSTLQRGRLNSGTSAHTTGARFVMLQRPSHINAQAAWINTDLTHRAISLGMSADDTDNDETQTYVGRSQTEWEPAYLELVRDGSDIITATWIRRGRFGSAFNPVLSVNYTADRITFDDGTTSVSFDTTAGEYTYDASAMGPSVTVTVTPINRITGAGPSSSGTV